MVYAQKVCSPLKGGVDVELSPKTLLLGENGAGKTAVLQALTLGTCGYVNDQEGRDGVRDTGAIARLFSSEDALRSAVLMSDGTTFSWESKRKSEGGFTEPDIVQPYPVAFPFHALKAILSGDQKRVKTWIDQRAGGVFSEKDLLDLLPPVQKDAGAKILKKFSERAPVELANALKKESTRQRTAATRQENTVSKLTEGLAPPLTPETVEELKEEQAKLRASISGSVSPEEHKALEGHMNKMVQRFEDLKATLAAVPADEEGTPGWQKLQKVHALAQQHLDAFGDGFCVVCQRDGADIAAATTIWAELAGKPPKTYTSERVRLSSAIEDVKGEAARLIDLYDSQRVVDATAVSDRISEIAAKLSANEAGKNTWAQAKAVRFEVASARSVADGLTSLSNTWNIEGALLLDRRKASYEKRVSKWLNDEKFAVDIDNGRVGFERGGEIQTALSGTELSRALLAILSDEHDGSTPTIHEPEDRAWDADTLSGVMAALAEAPSQIILMSTVAPTEVPPGWTVCHIG